MKMNIIYKVPGFIIYEDAGVEVRVKQHEPPYTVLDDEGEDIQSDQQQTTNNEDTLK